jgi:hypothetical protein
VIVLQFDSAYRHWGALLLQSLDLHEPERRVFCDTVNLTAAEEQQLLGVHRRVALANSFAPATPESMAARKPFVLRRAMDRFPGEHWYALLDADFLVRRPLNALWSLVESHPAALFHTDGYERGVYYRNLVNPSGIVLVRPDGRPLIDTWMKWARHTEPLGSIAPQAWFWDQVTLTEARLECGLRCEMIALEVFADAELRPESAIWSANVGCRKAEYYERFRAEYERQVAEAAPDSRVRAISA